ncbi:MAG: hypothetical protein KUG77_30025 [Nannocystaceae bacterium]|nr:hypothetical protein [Nannocystaceae bacterium]
MRRCWIGLGFVIVSASTGCYETPPMSLEGNLSVRGQELGTWDLDPGICVGGFGQEIDVSSHDGERCVRFVDDAERGPSIIAFVPGTLDGFVFTEADCDEFYVRLDRTVDQRGLLYDHGGEMALDCTTENGTISGRVQFDGCW